MHNCKTTTERVTELLLDGADPRLALPSELRECAACRAEFHALKETLQLTTQLIETATPPDSYWPGYHARLKERLRAAQQPHVEPGQYRSERQPSWLLRLFTASIRVPVPVGLALLLIVGVAFALKIRVPAEPVVVHVPVDREVPVVHEKTVTQIVYKERLVKPIKRTRILVPNDEAVASLDGFEPAEEVKLTVIKGGAANEK
ncbi:MAG TPA: hypothetical protein VFZ22_10265 [Pyrinomonadaceae bacterium]|nr:hypothetical protein [Pyrinomonadaceae bacterium]